MGRPDPALKIRHGARLPHWTREGSTYAVTFRLADSLPRAALDSWAFEREDVIRTAARQGRPLTSYEAKRLDALFSEKVDRYLDEGRGECWLQIEETARLVADALGVFHGTRYRLHAWCIMPNHVHVVAQPLSGHDLPEILHSWKSYTANNVNQVVGRRGRFWAVEYYDHLIRDERDFKSQVEYVLANPQKAGLKNWKWVFAVPLP